MTVKTLSRRVSAMEAKRDTSDGRWLDALSDEELARCDAILAGINTPRGGEPSDLTDDELSKIFKDVPVADLAFLEYVVGVRDAWAG